MGMAWGPSASAELAPWGRPRGGVSMSSLQQIGEAGGQPAGERQLRVGTEQPLLLFTESETPPPPAPVSLTS